jgi:hypothetical protein
MCDDDSILIFLDGDDFVAHPEVLAYVNDLYQDDEVWFTYGQRAFYSSGKPAWGSALPDWVVQQNLTRMYGWACGHLRTSRAWLAKQVKLVDFWYDGMWVPMSTDIALFLPMLEMAGKRARYCSKILYIYNDSSPLNMHTVDPKQQRSFDKLIRAKRSYTPLEEPTSMAGDLRTCVLILSYGNSDAVWQLIDSAQAYLVGAAAIHVLYHTNDKQRDAAYQALQRDGVRCVNLRNNVKTGLLDYVDALACDYIICADDATLCTKALDSRLCVRALEQTGGYAFYGSLSACDQNRPVQFNYIGDDLYAWQLMYGAKEWYQANTCNLAIYRKDTLAQQWRMIPFVALAELYRKWSALHMAGEIGLCTV